MATPAYNPDGSIPANFNPNMGAPQPLQIEPSKLTLAPEVYDPYNGSNDMLPPNPPKSYSPLNIISDYYQQELGRAPDEEGLNFWTKAAESGTPMQDIYQAINNSQEGQRFDINSLYKNELGREADAGGFDFWLNALQNGMSLDDIRNQGFRASEEYKNRVPEYKLPDNPYNEPQPAVYPEGYDPVTGTILDGRPPESGGPFNYGTPKQPFLDGRPPESGGPFDYGFVDIYNTQIPRNPNSPFSAGIAPQDMMGQGQLYEGIIPQPKIDPIKDFVENLDQQPLSLQRSFQQQLQRFGDPVQAARAVLGSFR